MNANVLQKIKNAVGRLTDEEKELDAKVRDFISDKQLDGEVIARMPISKELELKAVQDEIDALIERRDDLREQIQDEVNSEHAQGIYFIGIPVKASSSKGLDIKKLTKNAPATFERLYKKYGKDNNRAEYYQFRKRKGKGLK